MGALSGCAEIRFDSRSEPDARGEVTCTVALVSVPGQEEAAPVAPDAATVTVQAVFEVNQRVWADLSPRRSGSAVPGSSDVGVQVVSVRAARAPQA